MWLNFSIRFNNNLEGRGSRRCHNPIFTPWIFSGIGMQNEAVGLSWVQSESSSNASRISQNMVKGTFCEVQKGLTNIDQSWPELTKFDWSLTKKWPDQNQDLINHFLAIGKSTLRPSIRYFTGRKRTRNKEVIDKTVKIGPILAKFG